MHGSSSSACRSPTFRILSAPDPTVKRKTGVLTPRYSTSSVYGLGVTIPYYWALAPDYDATFTPMITTRQGPLLQGEWRQRLLDGAYSIRATGIVPARQGSVCEHAGLSRLARQPGNGGPVQSFGSMGVGLERHGAVGQELSCTTTACTRTCKFEQSASIPHPGLRPCPSFTSRAAAIAAISTLARCISTASHRPTSRAKFRVVHPVIDHDYVFKNPILGGEVEITEQFDQPVPRVPPISIRSRRRPQLDPFSFCGPTIADPAIKNSTNCLLRGVPGPIQPLLHRSVMETHGHRSVGPGVHPLPYACARMSPT